ncbi:aspartate/glutamate racemase family protein, partial [Campylobacter sp. 2018MI13]|nr:aspartate/glutamate racemase family protein [Campylobacter sp. 2018MI13]
TINDIIFNELCFNVIKQNSKETFINIINKHNIEGILLACTEIALLINENDFKNIKVFDTTYIHAKDIFLQSLE